MTSAASTFTVVASIGDSKIVYDRAASLPPRLCACEGWKPPDVSETNGDEDDDVEVVISVLAENPGGASAEATATLNLTRATLKAWAAASETKCEGADDIEEPPPTPPRAVTAERIAGVDGGVLVASPRRRVRGWDNQSVPCANGRANGFLHRTRRRDYPAQVVAVRYVFVQRGAERYVLLRFPNHRRQPHTSQVPCFTEAGDCSDRLP